METRLFIGDTTSNHIQVEVYNYEQALSDDSYDSNWLNCSVSVFCGAGTGKKFSVSLQTTDFKLFLEGLLKLNDSLKGEASFSTILKV